MRFTQLALLATALLGASALPSPAGEIGEGPLCNCINDHNYPFGVNIFTSICCYTLGGGYNGDTGKCQVPAQASQKFVNCCTGAVPPVGGVCSGWGKKE